MTSSFFAPPIAVLFLATACMGTQDPTEGTPAPTPTTPPSAAPPVVIVPNEAMESFSLSPALPPGFPDTRQAGTVQYPLHRLTGRYTFGPYKLPPKVAEVGDEFIVAVEEVPNPKGAPRALKVLRALLPFPVSSDDKTFRPVGMSVIIDNTPLEFEKGPAPKATKSTWRIKGRYLILSHPELPESGEIKIVYPGVKESIARHTPKDSGLTDGDFAQYGLTLGTHTRQGLMLPAPAVAEWDLKLPPEKATFRTWLALEPAPIAKPKSDGADAVLAIVSNGTTTEVARQGVEPGTRGYLPWVVDLAAFAGKEVTLRLTMEPRDNAAFDWVFLGSPAVSGAPTGEARRIIVIGLDTTRADHMGFNGYSRPSTPELDAFASSAAVFDKAWTPAPRTRPSFRSATTGRRPLDAVGAMNLSEVFQDAGFATAGIVANPHLQPRFGFDKGFDTWKFDGRAKAEGQVNDALAWLDAYQHRDTYLFLHFMDPHMIYDAPGEWREKFVTQVDPDLPRRVERSAVLGMMRRNSLTDVQKRQLEDLHDGEMAYMSHELGRFFDAVDAMPGRTLIVLHSDHGEEFWDHEGFEHNHTVYDEVTRAVLWVRPGGGLKTGQRFDAPATLADIAPTLYDAVGIKNPPPTDGRSLLKPILGTAEWSERSIPISQVQYSHERWAIVFRGHKYTLHTGTGREELYDLAADPGEKNDRSATTDLTAWREELAIAHSIDVGPGWRVRMELDGTHSVTMKLPEGAQSAGILDPEAIAEHRANVEWGQVPKVMPADVGSVVLSDDKRSLMFTPGPKPNGTVYVRFETEQTPQAAQLIIDGAPAEMIKGKAGRVWTEGKRTVRIEPGTVVVPPPTEADRMGNGGAARSAKETALLCSLGYIDCD